MSKNTLKFSEIKANKREFHKSKEPVQLGLIDTSKIVISEKFKISEVDFKHYFVCKERR